jgi:hypothetical protein
MQRCHALTRSPIRYAADQTTDLTEVSAGTSGPSKRYKPGREWHHCTGIAGLSHHAQWRTKFLIRP